MFTGIIQAIGRIHRFEAKGPDAGLDIEAGGLDLDDVQLGDSIAVNGVCLTVVALAPGCFSVDVSAETLSCTAGFEPGAEVSLEKALRLADRLGGHLVSGHVDGVGTVTRFDAVGGSTLLEIDLPGELARYVARKGSITVQGVSLTINRVEDRRFAVNLIPHTLEQTTLKHLQPGARVNLEVDLMARYAERLTTYDDHPT